MKATREQLVIFVQELGLVVNDTTTDEDIVLLITRHVKSLDPKTLSPQLQDFIESNKKDEEEDCFGKYYLSTSPECRQCLDAAICEVLSKGLSTPATLIGAKTNVPANLQKITEKKIAAKSLPQSQGISPKNQMFMDWVRIAYPNAQIIQKAVYFTIKKGNAVVVTIESVESNKPQYEIMFNRLKDPASLGVDASNFKHKYDGEYFIGTDIEALKTAFRNWWEKC